MDKAKLIFRICLFCAILSFVVCLLFLMHQVYDIRLPVATDIFGHYGDFVGGVIGTTLSVVLLYYTFKSQIKEFSSNAKVFEWQELNTTFFHLLDQYSAIINSLKVTEETDNYLTYKGKTALHYIYEQMRYSFIKGKANCSRKIAVGYYVSVYAEYRDSLPTYYRTIYRMLDVLDNAFTKLPNSKDNSNSIPLKYIKILRAQFTDSELLMIYYNANTQQGKNMREFIVKYNILKHMPVMNLLEYSQFCHNYTYSNRCKANDILINIRKLLCDLLKGENNNLAYTSYTNKYNLNVSCNEQRTLIRLYFTRNLQKNIPYNNEFTCFDTVPISDIKKLFDKCLHDELTIFRFRRLQLKSSSIDTTTKFKEQFVITLESPDTLQV